MNATQIGVITLLKSAINQQPYELPAGFDIEQAYPDIKRHHISALIFEGAVLCGISNGNVYESAKDFKELDNIVMSTFAPIYTYIKCWLLCDNGLDVASNF